MATRMQQRRGTAAQWISTNSGNGPILAAGEIGYESDTNKFKIGDGTNHWLNLDYFMDADSTVNPQFGSSIKFEGATANDFETTLAVTDPTADRTITLPNASGTVALMSDITDLIGTAGAALNTLGELSDALDDDASYAATITTALATKLSKADGGTMQAAIAMGSNKITGLSDPGAAQDAATKAYVDNTVSSYLPLAGGTLTGGINFEGSTADDFETALTVINPTADRVISLPDATGTVITTGNLADITNTGVFAGSIVFEGTTANEFETTLSVVDPTANRTITFQDLTGTVAFTGDIETHRTDATDVHGIADTADLVTKSNAQTLGGAKTFTGDVSLPTNTSIGTVTSTEIGYLDNVTSAIQTQLDAKAALASPTFTGTVTLPSGTVTSAMILDGTILVGDLADGAVTSAKILDGTIVNADINAGAAIDWTKLGISSTVSSTEIGYVDGVNSAIQTQLDAKAPLASPTFTGTVTTGHILPATNITSDLGSPSYMWRDIYVGPGSLYVNGQKVLQTDSGDVVVTADSNQNLVFRTSGDGDIEIDPTGSGSVSIKGPLVIQTGQNISMNDGSAVNFTGAVKTDTISSKTTNTDLSLSADGTGKVYLNDNAEVSGNLVVGGNLTISGTTTTVNSETISLADNLIDLNSNFTTGTPTENSGIRVMRGDLSAVQVRWNESTDKWEITNDGTNYSSVAGLESPTFTGTVTIPSGASISGFATTASPTFTGTVTVAASGVAFTDGTQTKAGVPSITPRVEASDSYNLLTGGLTLRDSIIEINAAGGTTLTIPTNATTPFPVGTSIDILQVGAGQVTVSGAVGVTLNYTPGNKLRTQWSSATLFKRAENTWVLMGDLSA